MACKLPPPATCNGNELDHLWAPTAMYVPADKKTLLYVPDIYGDTRKKAGISGDDQISYIAVAESTTKPWGPFTYKKNITWGGGDIRDNYMSDPAVTTIGWSHPYIDENWRDSKTNEYPAKDLLSLVPGRGDLRAWCSSDGRAATMLWGYRSAGCGTPTTPTCRQSEPAVLRGRHRRDQTGARRLRRHAHRPHDLPDHPSWRGRGSST